MKLSSLLNADRVMLDAREKNKSALLSQMVTALAALGGVGDAVVLDKEIKDREELGNTGIGRGIGFPHSKSTQVKDIMVMLARPAKPIEYGAIDNTPVSIILMIVAPADGDNNEYLHTMARISRLLGKSDVRQKILAAARAQDVVEIVKANET